MSFVTSIIEFISAHPGLAYAAVFLLALSEAIPVIGVIVPGSAIIIGISALVPTGAVTVWPLLITAITGAIAGDGISYWFGRQYHQAILSRWPLNRQPGLLAKGERFIELHGGKSIFLSRFTPARAFVPLIAGILHMPVRRFYIANIVSAFVWAPAHVIPGLLVGASLSLAGDEAGRLAVLLIALIILIWLIIWFVRLTIRYGVPRLAAGQQKLWQWTQTREGWIAEVIKPLIDPSRSETRVLTLWAIVIIAAAWLFLGILEDVVTGDTLVTVDAAIYAMLQQLRTSVGDRLLIGVTELGDTVVVLCVAISVFLALLWQRAWRTAAYWIAAIGFAGALNTGIKLAIHRARPGEMAYTGVSEFSFPSGHTTVNAVMYGFLAFIIARQYRAIVQIPVFAVALSFIVLIAFSRIYLGAHWFSDVSASLTFAAMWLIVMGLAYHYHVGEINVRPLAFVAIAALIVAGSINVYWRYPTDVVRYSIQREITTIPADEWWRGSYHLPAQNRLDIEGERQEPMTVQWSGSLQSLQAQLGAAGWKQPVFWSLASTMAWTTATTDPALLPVLPFMNSGRLPSLVLIRPAGEGGSAPSRYVLRLWRVDTQVTASINEPLWIGSVVAEQLSFPYARATLVSEKPNYNEPRDAVASALAGSKLLPLNKPYSDGKWDGRVLLAKEY